MLPFDMLQEGSKGRVLMMGFWVRFEDVGVWDRMVHFLEGWLK